MTYNDKGPDNVQKFVDSYDLSFPIVLMENDKLLQDYEVLSMPSTIFIDTDGRVQHQYTGALNQKKLKQFIDQLN